MFAFSRDGGLPFSRYLYRINRRTQTPVNCVWASIFCMFLLGLLVFAGPTVINAIFSLGVVGQYIAFGLPIASRFLGGTPLRPGPFTLGKMASYHTNYKNRCSNPVYVSGLAGLLHSFAVDCLLYFDSHVPKHPKSNCAKYELHGGRRRGMDYPVSHLLLLPTIWRQILVLWTNI